MLRVPHIDMPTMIFSTFALLGCAFLIYVWFHWLREELDLKRPAHRDRQSKPLPPRYVIYRSHR
jgi:threonine/homoserine/homoserine lactone efflux protein